MRTQDLLQCIIALEQRLHEYVFVFVGRNPSGDAVSSQRISAQHSGSNADTRFF